MPALGERTTIGGGAYWITGSSRIDARRAFSDSAYLSIRQTAELSYQGFGLSVGILHQLSPSIQLAGLLRTDGKAATQRAAQRDAADAYRATRAKAARRTKGRGR